MYTISIYNPQEFNNEKLRKSWRILDKGPDMSYFQTYDWYRTVIKFLPKDSKHSKSLFILIEKDSFPILIAPIWIVTKKIKFVNRKGCYFMGRNGWSDYLNFIYDKFDSDAVLYLLDQIKAIFNVSNYYLEQVKEETHLYDFIKDNFSINKEVRTTCVGVNLPNTKEQYTKSLSKNIRQNIRTAHNRLVKDNLEIVITHNDTHADHNACTQMRLFGLARKNKKALKDKLHSVSHNIISLINSVFNYKKIRNRIVFSLKSKLSIKFPEYLPYNEDDNSHLLTGSINNELAAFFNYGIDSPRHGIVMMAAGTNSKYYRYSPGILAAYDFILQQIEKGDIKYVDFTRGDEKYKYYLNGEEHYIWSLNFDYSS